MEGDCPSATAVHFALFPPSGGSGKPPTTGQGEIVSAGPGRDEAQVRVTMDPADGDEPASDKRTVVKKRCSQ